MAELEASRAKRKVLWGALVVCVVLAISYLFLRNWTSYTPRAKMTEVVLGLMGYKNDLEAYFLAHKRLPKDASEARISLEPTNRYIRQISYDGVKGELKAVIKDIPDNEGKSLVLKVDTSTGALTWRCLSDDIAPRHLPSSCRQ